MNLGKDKKKKNGIDLVFQTISDARRSSLHGCCWCTAWLYHHNLCGLVACNPTPRLQHRLIETDSCISQRPITKQIPSIFYFFHYFIFHCGLIRKTNVEVQHKMFKILFHVWVKPKPDKQKTFVSPEPNKPH